MNNFFNFNDKKFKNMLSYKSTNDNRKYRLVKTLNANKKVKDTPFSNTIDFDLYPISDYNCFLPIVSPIFNDERLFSWKGNIVNTYTNDNTYYGQVWIYMSGKRHGNNGDYFRANSELNMLMQNSGYIVGSESVPIDCDIFFQERWFDNPPTGYVWHYVLMCGYPPPQLYNNFSVNLPYQITNNSNSIGWNMTADFLQYPVNSYSFGETFTQPVLLQLVEKEIHDATLPHYDSIDVWEYQLEQIMGDQPLKYGD
ncbi:MAG: hypothetical protein Pg6B_04520 [Candidatus Azobacteroides pseudotrichonymphae]|uniref:Uncharacterized protein n=1 Tax=Candidatus Improbicoccus pseudotrichonymphae TaxID=3033792 RepID=A0AA48KYX0_9FIRM|nr:MAG: hypothetical protein CfP315_0206 [Candidatus Improbicoccus pseudotrichonymphae]GMO34106.1 MAG: hypothetical protein Pg6B_04520 [Candidatus Azobacteroides pseudotrichonymphae]